MNKQEKDLVKLGMSILGKRSAAKLTAEQRSERARKAGSAKGKKVTWKQPKNGVNYVLDHKDFFVSYNPNTGAGNLKMESMTLMAQMLGADVRNGIAETALCVRPNKWMILNGDFRAEYEKAFPKGMEACIKVYKKNIKHRSNWSTD